MVPTRRSLAQLATGAMWRRRPNGVSDTNINSCSRCAGNSGGQVASCAALTRGNAASQRPACASDTRTVVAAATAGAPTKGDHRAERSQVAGGVVERIRGSKARSAVDSVFGGDAADRLDDAVEAAPVAPGPAVAERADRDVHDARPSGDNLFDPKPRAASEPAGSPAKRRRHVGSIARAASPGPHSTDPARWNACRGRCRASSRRCQGGSGADAQHLGAVLGQGSRAGRPGEHARQVEHAQAPQWSGCWRQGLGALSPSAQFLK